MGLSPLRAHDPSHAVLVVTNGIHRVSCCHFGVDLLLAFHAQHLAASGLGCCRFEIREQFGL